MNLPATAIGAGALNTKRSLVSQGVVATNIATTPRERLSATGAQGCSNDWWQLEVLTEARESVFHQDSSNCLLYLIVASIKSLTSGIRWR